MENYIISNNTIAILKKNNKTYIYNVENIRVINKNIKKILELNCYFYGNDLNLVKKYAKKLLNISYKIPIIINKDVILIQINNIRNNNCIFINVNKIIEYKYINNLLEINCYNQKFQINISKYSFEKLLIKSFILNNLINYKKNINFV